MSSISPVHLDVDFVRAQFPAFREPSLDGWAFFENAGGSYAAGAVIDRLCDFYTRTKVQPYYGYPASIAAGEAMDAAYRRFAAYLNVAEDEVHFGPSTTQNIDILARALRQLWSEGDEIVVSNQDHEANSGAWRRLAEQGIVVHEWQIDSETGRLDPAQLAPLLTEKTRLVAFPHCSNVIGEINPVAEISRLASDVGATVVVDGVSYAPHGLPDIEALGVDVYLFSLYKTWGPHLGVMTVRRDLLDALPGQGHFFNAENPRKKLLVAGPDHGQIAAASGVTDYLDAVFEHHFPDASVSAGTAEAGRLLSGLFQRHEQELLEPLLAFLDGRDDVRVLGPTRASGRAPTVSLLPQCGSRGLFESLTDHKLMLGVGDFYGVRPLRAMGIPLDPGVVRLSFVHYTTGAEIDQLIAGLASSLDALAG